MKKNNTVQFNTVIPKELFKKIKEHALEQDITVRLWTYKAFVEFLAYEEEQKKKYQ